MKPSSLAIACESGGFRCVFVHGALDALEEAGVRAATYAAASASVLPAAFAAVGMARTPGVIYWRQALAVRMAEGNGMSEMVLAGIAAYAPIVVERLMMPDTPRFVVAASEVIDVREAEKTQGTLASRLGREQLLAMARGDDTWARASLRARMFDTRSTERALTAENFSEVAYASTRMLHAWRVPAEIGGRPFIDASYTVGFPVLEVAGDGAERVLAIATSTAAAHRNLYMKELIPQQIDDVSIEVLAPEVDLKELGVDFTTASEEGLARAYDHGRDVARAWLDRQNNEDAAFMPPAW